MDGKGELVSGRWDLRKDSEVRRQLGRLLQVMVLYAARSHGDLRGHLRTLVASNQELTAPFRRHSIWLSELVVITHIFSIVEG